MHQRPKLTNPANRKAVRVAQAIVTALLVVIGVNVATSSEAFTAGTCWNGTSYGGGGTNHNWVEFHVNVSAPQWHVEKEWWAVFPIQLWNWPGQLSDPGLARAGINGTDLDPWYSPNGYRICTGSGPQSV